MDWEEELRRDEIKLQRRHLMVSIPALIIGFVTAAAAVFAALQAAKAVSTAQDAVERTAREQRLTNGIQAMGGDTAAQRIAGIALMRRSVTEELNRVAGSGDSGDATLERDRRNARAAYLSTIDALENYVGAWGRPDVEGLRGASYDSPTSDVGPTTTARPSSLTASNIADYVVPKDVIYAANELQKLVDPELKPQAETLDAVPSLDLANAALWGISWPDFDPDWLTAKWFAAIDLRGANLTRSDWGTSFLGEARLQCAKLSHATFSVKSPNAPSGRIGAVLSRADLRGAVLTDADLRSADLRNAQLEAADLSRADLRGAKIAGAVFSGAEMSNTDLEGAKGVAKAVGLGTEPVDRQSLEDLDICFSQYWAPLP